jgi:hypothetical protein
MASKYYVGSGNWTSATNWKTASGGATTTTPPTASDTAFLDVNSGAVAIDATTCIAGLLNCTNYANTLTFTAGQQLQINSTLTFVAGMTIAGTGKLKLGTTSATITSGGKTITGDLEISGSTTKTLSGAWIVNGLFSTSGSGTTTLNGSTITLNGGMSLGQTVTGTTTATLTGGTLISTLDGAGWGLTTSYAGNITIDDWGIEKGTHTYSSGTITHTATKTLHLCGGNACTPTINWGTNIRVKKMKLTGGRATFVITGTMYIDDDFDIFNGGIFSITSGTMNINKSIIQTGTGSLSFFTTSGVLVLAGTGDINIPWTNWGNLTINTAGTITFKSTAIMAIGYSSAARTFTYTAGTVVVEDGFQLRVGADSTSLNTGSIIWDVVVFGVQNTGTNIINLTGDFICKKLWLGTFSNSNPTTAVNLPNDGRAALSVRIANTKTLTIKEKFYCYRGQNTTQIRTTSGTAYIDYQGTLADMDISNCDFGIVAGGSRLTSVNRIYTFNGSILGLTDNIFLVRSLDVLDSGLSISHL